MEPRLRKCGRLTLAVHQTHASNTMARLRLGCDVLGSEPNTPLMPGSDQVAAGAPRVWAAGLPFPGVERLLESSTGRGESRGGVQDLLLVIKLH